MIMILTALHTGINTASVLQDASDLGWSSAPIERVVVPPLHRLLNWFEELKARVPPRR
jgi:hypothetical protein